jgi:hypothetical protein
MNLSLMRPTRPRHDPKVRVGLVVLVALGVSAFPLSAGCHRTTASEDTKPKVMRSSVRSRRGRAMYSTTPTGGGAPQGGQTAP